GRADCRAAEASSAAPHRPGPKSEGTSRVVHRVLEPASTRGDCRGHAIGRSSPGKPGTLHGRSGPWPAQRSPDGRQERWAQIDGDQASGGQGTPSDHHRRGPVLETRRAGEVVTSRQASLIVRPVAPRDATAWLRLRCALWPEGSESEHASEITEFLDGRVREPLAVLVAQDG